MRVAMPPFPNTSSWRGALLRTGTTLLYFLLYFTLLYFTLLYAMKVYPVLN
jgi:hypothetical protein